MYVENHGEILVGTASREREREKKNRAEASIRAPILTQTAEIMYECKKTGPAWDGDKLEND